MTRAAGILFCINGAGFGLFAIPGIIRLSRHQPIPYVFGFPAYGHGPFERIGLPTTVPLLVAFLLVNIAQVVAGGLVLAGARAGAIIGLVAFPFAAVFWWGFELPFGPALGIPAAILLGLGWARLH